MSGEADDRLQEQIDGDLQAHCDALRGLFAEHGLAWSEAEDEAAAAALDAGKRAFWSLESVAVDEQLAVRFGCRFGRIFARRYRSRWVLDEERRVQLQVDCAPGPVRVDPIGIGKIATRTSGPAFSEAWRKLDEGLREHGALRS